MEKQCFGNELSTTILIQPVDDHDLGFIENEVKLMIFRLGRRRRCLGRKVSETGRRTR